LGQTKSDIAMINVTNNFYLNNFYRAFHRFGLAKFPDGGSVLGSSLFSILPQLPPKYCSIQKWSKLTEK